MTIMRITNVHWDGMLVACLQGPVSRCRCAKVLLVQSDAHPVQPLMLQELQPLALLWADLIGWLVHNQYQAQVAISC